MTEARTEAGQSSDLAEAFRLIEAALPDTSEGRSARDIRAIVADRKAALAGFNEARLIADDAFVESHDLRSEAFVRDLAEAESLAREADIRVRASSDKVAIAEQPNEVERLADAEATHFAALLEHGSALGLQNGHCPLCDTARTDAEFASSIVAIRQKLAGRAESLAKANQTLVESQAELAASRDALSSASERLAQLRGRRAALDAVYRTVQQKYSETGFADVPADDLIVAEVRAGEEQQKIVALERASLILGASVAGERVISLESQLAALRERLEKSAKRVSDAENVLEICPTDRQRGSKPFERNPEGTVRYRHASA